MSLISVLKVNNLPQPKLSNKKKIRLLKREKNNAITND
jgi:hypothetical protein